jgi:hypothetical protein
MNTTGIGDVSGSASSRLAALLMQTAEAHREYELRELQGMNDEQWPTWYAVYLRQNGLPQLLEGLPRQQVVIDGLESILVDADADYTSSPQAQTEDWPQYYARYLLRCASDEEGE